MWQLTRTLVCSSYEPNLRVYLKYKSSVAVNKGDWQLGPCLHIAWPSPAGDLHVLLEVGVQSCGSQEGGEARTPPCNPRPAWWARTTRGAPATPRARVTPRNTLTGSSLRGNSRIPSVAVTKSRLSVLTFWTPEVRIGSNQAVMMIMRKRREAKRKEDGERQRVILIIISTLLGRY